MIQFSILKSSCVLCDALIEGKLSLCEGCRVDLPRVEFACKTCGLPIESDTKSSICGQCITQKTYVDYAQNIFFYDNPVDYLISQMKFQQQLSAAAVLADLFKKYFKSSFQNDELAYGLPDAFLPMPLHNKRLAKRGFNQSLELIKPLAASLNIPIALDIAARTKETTTQTHLNKLQRKKNVSGCFTLSAKPKKSHIVIVDDVVTTGATTNELAKLLKQAGVKKVGVWSLARAELN